MRLLGIGITELQDRCGASPTDCARSCLHNLAMLVVQGTEVIGTFKLREILLMVQGHGVHSRAVLDCCQRRTVAREIENLLMLLHRHARVAVCQAGRRVVDRLVTLNNRTDRCRNRPAEI